MIRVLCIDPDYEQHQTLQLVFSQEFTIQSAYSGKEGLTYVKHHNPEIILLALDLPDMEGTAFLQQLMHLENCPPVIMISDINDVRFIVKSIKMGATDYIQRPYNLKHLKLSIQQALTISFKREYRSVDPLPEELNGIVGESEEIRNIKQKILKFAPAESPIILTGESGTGKDVVAHAIHRISSRKNGPFIALNCGALPSTIIESELFGSEKGAFTDAVRRPGSFEQADQGTLFLDEIGEMEKLAQVKLLRVIENQKITRVGGIRQIPVNVRIISATNTDLKLAVAENQFRKDLYYRINTLTIHIPPLRRRKMDIPLLVKHFIQQNGNPEIKISPHAMEKLIAYPWPGNVRELRNVIDRAVLLTETDSITAENISF